MKVLAEQNDKKMKEELARHGLAKNNHANDMLDVQYTQLSADYKDSADKRVNSEKSEMVKSLSKSLAKLESLRSHAHGLYFHSTV